MHRQSHHQSRWAATALVAAVVLVGCGSSESSADLPSSGVEGVVAAPVQSDAEPTPVPPVGDRLETVRQTTADYVEAQIAGSEAAVGEPQVWLRPGDTGARYIVDWQATTSEGLTSGGATLLADSGGGFTVDQFVVDDAAGADAVPGLVADSFVVSIEDRPSQSPEDATRDGIPGIVAEVPLYARVDMGWGAPDYLTAQTDIGKRWILSRYPLELGQALRQAGELAAVDTILAYELLELSASVTQPAEVLRAVPLDVLSPAWVAQGDGAIYSGRRAPSSRLNPVLIRIDEATGEVERLVAVVPDRVISNPLVVPAGWTVATPEQTELMMEVKHVNPDFVMIDEIFAMAG